MRIGIVKALFISLMLIGTCIGRVFADSEFTPLNFSDATYISGTPVYNTEIAATSANEFEIKNSESTQSSGNSNMQSAISQLDSAQVEVRTELLKYRTKYNEVDAQYKKVKAERASLAKQVKACEKKIKELDNTKEKIRKNMI